MNNALAVGIVVLTFLLVHGAMWLIYRWPDRKWKRGWWYRL